MRPHNEPDTGALYLSEVLIDRSCAIVYLFPFFAFFPLMCKEREGESAEKMQMAVSISKRILRIRLTCFGDFLL